MSAVSEPRAAALDRFWQSGDRAWSNPLFAALYDRWFRVAWDGLEHVPAEGGALLVANHAGMLPLDGGFIQLGIEREAGRRVYSLAHHGFWRVPFMGPLLSRGGAVVAHPENADRLLREGDFVVVFPEGSKGPVKPPGQRYKLQRFGRGGFVETAMRAGVPVVPITLLGTEDATPMVATPRLFGRDVPLTANMLLFGPLLGVTVQLPVKVRARVLPPVHFDLPSGLARYPRSVVMDEAEAIRERMQESLDAMRRRRKSLWTG